MNKEKQTNNNANANNNNNNKIMTDTNSSASSSIDVCRGDTDHSNDHHRDASIKQQQPATELHLRWTNLTKQVEIKEEKTILKSDINKVTPNSSASGTKTNIKVILNHVSGEARPGEILVTMGPSGSGKTSLMNVLSGRATYQEGSITINGQVLDKAGMKKLMSKVAYVKQQDVFFETISVKDQLTYTARLRFPDDVGTKQERAEKIRTEVDRIIQLLRLTKVADSPIMMCSGGEKKRVNIGTELLTDPSIIMLDEPTSGLDSASAVSLLGVLKDLAKNHGKTIITSIHQPNSATFLNTFDKLLMLSDGNAVYFGKPAESLQYLRSKDFACPEGYNAADHWMDLLVTDSSVEEERLSNAATAATTGESGDVVEATSSVKDGKSPRFYLQKAWDNDAIAAQMDVVSEIQHQPNAAGGVSDVFKMDDIGRKYATSWWTQFTTLTHRALAKGKSTVFSPINIGKTIATGIMVGIVYLNQTYTEADVFNIYAYFFFTMLFWVMNGMFEALFAFPQERVIILKERATASYRLSAYFTAMTVADLPVFLFMPFIYLVISYWMTVPTLGFTTFICILCIALLSVITGQGMGQFIGAAFDDVQVGQAFATVVILFLMLLGGFFAQNLPIWLAWVQYISPFAYASNAALLVIFRKPIPCDGSGALSPLCEVGDTTGSFADPRDVLDSLKVTLSVGANVACLVLYCVVPRLFAYYFLRRKKAGERE